MTELRRVRADALGRVRVTGASGTAGCDADGALRWATNLPSNGLALVLDSSSNLFLSATGATVKLDQTNPPGVPVLTAAPADRTVGPGVDVAFNVGVSGTMPLHYQWRVNARPIAASRPANHGSRSVAIRSASTKSSPRPTFPTGPCLITCFSKGLPAVSPTRPRPRLRGSSTAPPRNGTDRLSGLSQV